METLIKNVDFMFKAVYNHIYDNTPVTDTRCIKWVCGNEKCKGVRRAPKHIYKSMFIECDCKRIEVYSPYVDSIVNDVIVKLDKTPIVVYYGDSRAIVCQKVAERLSIENVVVFGGDKDYWKSRIGDRLSHFSYSCLSSRGRLVSVDNPAKMLESNKKTIYIMDSFQSLVGRGNNPNTWGNQVIRILSNTNSKVIFTRVDRVVDVNVDKLLLPVLRIQQSHEMNRLARRLTSDFEKSPADTIKYIDSLAVYTAVLKSMLVANSNVIEWVFENRKYLYSIGELPEDSYSYSGMYVDETEYPQVIANEENTMIEVTNDDYGVVYDLFDF